MVIDVGDENDSRVVITMRDVYNEVKQASAKIAGLEQTIGNMVGANGATHATQEQRFADMDRRLRDAEGDIRKLQLVPVVTTKSMWTAISILGGFFLTLSAIITTIVIAVAK